ncbi:OmpH family outer membrane protein [Arenibacter palladensis]|uniref:OmpH family outer membrane protein n=1 Tax=Arenibacter palladensis TaxID=237373 RepID=UPI002FD4C278
MKTILRKIGFITTVILLMCASVVWGQKKTKTFHENFNVTNEVVLELSTSYADIEFETWNKNQVDITAVVELEDVSEEEANNYFKREPVKIVGNSKNISISTALGHREFVTYNTEDIDIDFLDQFNGVGGAHNIAPLVELPELPELPEVMELPPLPPMNIQPFDYEAYKKDGEAYLKEWKKEFDKGFGKDYESKMEEWSKKMDLKRAESDKRRLEMEKKREEAHQERLEKLQEIQSQRMEINGKAQEQMAKSITSGKQLREIQKDMKTITIEIDSTDGKSREFIFMEERHPTAPNVFYSIKKGGDKNLKVKKTIKIKLPKSTKIKMNVRHGEVILAESTKNLSATLSYSTLLASTIDGDKTYIDASYSPVSVQKWNYGQLKADYSEKVNIKEVENLTLNATFSDVTIENLMQKAFIKNNFGPLVINSISKDFTDLDVNLQNAEFRCVLPQTAFNIAVNGTNSELVHPKELHMVKTKNGYNTLNKGYHINKTSGKSIIINSKFTEVVLR